MKPRYFILAAALALWHIEPAHAFWGVGDVSFDPTSYGELVSIYSELQQAYLTLTRELTALQDIKDLTTRAQRTINTVRNKDYYALAAGLAPADALDSLDTTRAQIEALLGKDPRNSAVYEVELQQLAGIAQLKKLQAATARNLGQSALDLSRRDSDRVTAQSTAALAALAAAEAQRRSTQTAAAAQAEIDARGLVTGASAIYRSLGSQ